MHLFGILRSQLSFIDGSSAEAIIVQSQAFAIAKCHANGQVEQAALFMSPRPRPYEYDALHYLQACSRVLKEIMEIESRRL